MSDDNTRDRLDRIRQAHEDAHNRLEAMRAETPTTIAELPSFIDRVLAEVGKTFSEFARVLGSEPPD
jgi:hypothetical protein